MSQRKKCSRNVAVRGSLGWTYLWLPSNALPSQVHRPGLCASFSRPFTYAWASHLLPPRLRRLGLPPAFPQLHHASSPRSVPTSTHTHCSVFWPRALPSSWATCLFLLHQCYTIELSLLLVPTFSPSRSLNSLPSDFYTPNLPISLTYKWTPIVCPTLF